MNIGVDIGFSHTKAVCGNRSTTFPSFVTPTVESWLNMNHRDRIVISCESGEFMMGQSAVEIGQGTRQETGDWIGTPQWMALLYGALSEITTSTNFTANITIGLPISDYERKKRLVVEIVKGDHTFVRRGRVMQHCHVENVIPAPQGWGAILDGLLTANGKLNDSNLGRNRYATIDIGGHNVSYLAIDGLADLPHESRPTERGAWTIVRAVRLFLDNNYPGLSRHKDHTIMQAIIDREIYDGNNCVDLSPVVNPLIDQIGQEIVDTAGQHWGEGARTFRQVFIIGGGAHIWGERIRQAFPHAVILDDPQMVNARGFAKFAAFRAGGE